MLIEFFRGPAGNRRLLSLVAVLVVFGVLFAARGALPPFFIGLILAYLLLPAARRIERWMPFRTAHPSFARVLAVSIVYLIVILIVVLIATLVFPVVFRQVNRFIEALPNMASQAREVLQLWTAELLRSIPEEIRSEVEAVERRLAQDLIAAAQDAVVQSALVITQTFSVLIGIFAIPVWLFYVLKDRRRGIQSFYALFPDGIRLDVQAIIGIVDSVLSSYIRAQLFLAFVVGIATWIGLELLGVPFAIVLGITAGITEFIPIIGPLIAGSVVIVVTLASAPDKVVWVILLTVFIQQVENNLLVPRVQGKAVDIHPAIIILLLVIASEIAGFVGLLVVVPLAAVSRHVFLYLHRRLSNGDEVAPV